MISIASTWLGLALLLCLAAWLVNRRLIVLALPVASVIAAGALWVPTGFPRFTEPPPGQYHVVGAKIDVDVAIYVLLDRGGVPTYYVLPYSAQKAGELQAALDTAGGEGPKASFTGQEGGETYEGEPPVTAADVKPAPALPEYTP